MGPKITKTEHGLEGLANGEVVWSYDGRLATGKGIYIAATARAGTVYMTEVLNALGYKVGHEKVGVDGSVGYHLALVKPENCFHQVRHPLKQIASMKAHNAWGFMEDVIDIPRRGLLGCMTYWLKWNELLEEFCVWRYQLEQLPDIWNEFLGKIGHEKCEIPDVSTKTNSSTQMRYIEKFRYETLDWRDLFDCNEELADQIVSKAIEYGYKAP
jgi:hypothetical protein